MRLIAIIVLGACALVLLAAGEARDDDTARGFLFESIDVDGMVYDYVVYVPRDYAPDKAWPLILFLHGSGESGTDGQHQVAVGLGPRVLWNPEQYPAVIVFPQKPDADDEWEDHADAVGAMLARAMREYRIDADRVSLTGLSQGGHGVWTINAAMPGTFSALAPMCSYVERPERRRGRTRWGWNPESEDFVRIVDAAKGTPTWVFHGEADSVVSPDQAKSAVERLRGAGAPVKLTTYPDVGHNCWDQAYGSEGLGAWLIEQRRAE